MHIWKVGRHSYPATALALAASAIGLLAPPSAHAGLIASFTAATAAPGSDQFIEVLLQNTGSPVTVDAFTFDLTTSNPFISFTQANTSTVAATYIFAGNSSFGPIVSTTPPPAGQTLIASDLAVCCGTLLATNSTFALGQVRFHVAANATSGTALLQFDSNGTTLADTNGNGIPITSLSTGQISITGAPVPEPSTFSMFAPLALFCAAAAVRRLRIVSRNGGRHLAKF